MIATAAAVAGFVALSATVVPAQAAIAQKFAPAALSESTHPRSYRPC
jgi:hypothetical protein